MSWKPEVIADSSGQWAGNALRFATSAEAQAYVEDLSWRWTAVRQTRTTESDEPVNYAWKDGKAVEIDRLAFVPAKRHYLVAGIGGQ